MNTFDWEAFSREIAAGTPSEVLLEKIAEAGAFVPPGQLARFALTEWADLGAPLRGGFARFGGGRGFRLNGLSDEPFLTVALRDEENAVAVLSDLWEKDPTAFEKVFVKIRKAVVVAESLLKGVGSSGSPPQAKAMMSALHKRVVSLGKCVLAHFPEAGAVSAQPVTETGQLPEDTPDFDGLKALLTGKEEWSPREVVEGIAQLHRAAAKERLRSGRMGRFGKLERSVFGDPKPYFRRKRGMGLGFSASLMSGPEHDLFTIAGLQLDYELESRVWDTKNWKTLLEECDGVDLVELEERDLAPGSTDVNYWIRIGDPSEFARALRHTILAIGYPIPTSGVAVKD